MKQSPPKNEQNNNKCICTNNFFTCNGLNTPINRHRVTLYIYILPPRDSHRSKDAHKLKVRE